eukprot:SAG31_NODE_154_length_22184_cov_25.917142_11_plen_298_part_00
MHQRLRQLTRALVAQQAPTAASGQHQHQHQHQHQREQAAALGHSLPHTEDELQAVRKAFEQQGFVVIRELLHRAKVLALRHRCNIFAETIAPTLPTGQVIYDPDGELRHITDIGIHDAKTSVWRGVEADPAVLALVEKSLLPSRSLRQGRSRVSSEIFWKPPRSRWVAPPHQDNAYVFYVPGHCDAVAIWVAVDDSTGENGGVRYAFGSHTLGDLEHELGTEPPFSKALTPAAARSIDCDRQYPWVDLQLSAGDAICHNYLTVHASGVNTSDRVRRGFVINCTCEATARSCSGVALH